MRRSALAAALVLAGCARTEVVLLDVDPGDVVVAAELDGAPRSIGIVQDDGHLELDILDMSSTRLFVLKPGTDLIAATEAGPSDAFAELTVGGSEDNFGCGRCLYPTPAGPLLIHPGSGCAIPTDVRAFRSDGSEAKDEETALLRDRLLIGWQSECHCREPELLESSRELDVEQLYPKEDFWPAETLAVGPQGDFALFGSELRLLVKAGGQRIDHSDQALPGAYKAANRWSGGFVATRRVEEVWFADVFDSNLELLGTTELPLGGVRHVDYFSGPDALFIGGDAKGNCEGNQCATLLSCRASDGLDCAEISPPRDPVGAESYQQVVLLDDGTFVGVGKEGAVLIYERAPPPESTRVTIDSGTTRGTVEVQGEPSISWWGFPFPLDETGLGPLQIFGAGAVFQRGQQYYACVLGHDDQTTESFTMVLTGSVAPGAVPSSPNVSLCIPAPSSDSACGGFSTGPNDTLRMLVGSKIVDLDLDGHALGEVSGTGRCPARVQSALEGAPALQALRQTPEGLIYGVELATGAVVQFDDPKTAHRTYGADGLQARAFAVSDQLVLIDGRGIVRLSSATEIEADPTGGQIEGLEPPSGFQHAFQQGERIFATGRDEAGAWLRELDLEGPSWVPIEWPSELAAFEPAGTADGVWLVLTSANSAVVVRDAEVIEVPIPSGEDREFLAVGGAEGVGWIVGRSGVVYRVNTLEEEPSVDLVALPDRIASEVEAGELPPYWDIDSDCADGVRISNGRDLETVRNIGEQITLEAFPILEGTKIPPSKAYTGIFRDLSLRGGRAIRRFDNTVELFPEAQRIRHPSTVLSAARTQSGPVIVTTGQGRILLAR